MILTSQGPTVGVIGGGQLCRMLAEAAAPLGVKLIFVDPKPDAPANQVAAEQIVGDFDDADAINTLASRSHFLTYDIELADPDVVESVSKRAEIPAHPHAQTLRIIEDKFDQKKTLQNHNIPVPDFRRIDSVTDLRNGLNEFGYPAMLKARSGGYDGRGNILIETPTMVEEAFESIGSKTMLEEYLDFERELSVIGVKGKNDITTYPVTETIHKDEILRRTVTPARCSYSVEEKAISLAHDVLEVMKGRGVYGIEMFEVDGEVLINEIAPRPHNSGHWSIEGAYTSQFNQHLRAVIGRPLGDPGNRCKTVTENILGSVDESRPARLDGVNDVLKKNRVFFHWYGKKQVRPLRKMGHITAVDSNTDELLSTTQTLRKKLRFK